MRPSAGEKARALSVTDIVMKAKNVRVSDKARVMSITGTELWLCQMAALEH